MIRLLCGALFAGLGLNFATAQNTDLRLDHPIYDFVDRLDIRGYTEEALWTGTKPLGRSYLTDRLKGVYQSDLSYGENRRFARIRLLLDDSAAVAQRDQGVVNFFYKNGRDFLHRDGPNFRLFFNPILGLYGGLERFDGGETDNVTANRRGLLLRGTFFNRLGFYTEVYDNILRAPQFLQERYRSRGTLPGETFIKPFNQGRSFDFFHARSYLTYSPFSAMRIKFGYDRAHWGYGYQSLLLSGYSANHLMLNIHTRIWKLEYTNHFAQLIDFIPNKPDNVGTYPRKYAVFHQLSYQPVPEVSLGIFESVVYAPTLANGPRGLELTYLNPIIFYRSVEQSLGSPDNGFIGLMGKANVWRKVQFYGQLLIDDFNFSQFRDDPTYWGNKTGYQLGAKWVDPGGLPGALLQVEYNQVRPYVYQHFNVSSNYTHYGQYLGHANGANLREALGRLAWQPHPSWRAELIYRYTHKGRDFDPEGANYGGDERRSDALNRFQDFGVITPQGDDWRVHTAQARLSYQLFRTDSYLDIEGIWRRENGVDDYVVRSGLRVGLAPWRVDY